MQRASQPGSRSAQSHRFGVTGKALNAGTAPNFLNFVPSGSQARQPKAAQQAAQQSESSKTRTPAVNTSNFTLSQGASPLLSPQSPLRRDLLRPSHFEAAKAEREREEQVQMAQSGKVLNQRPASQGLPSAALLGREVCVPHDSFLRSSSQAPAQTRAPVSPRVPLPTTPLDAQHHQPANLTLNTSPRKSYDRGT